jgi:hypothetical protein
MVEAPFIERLTFSGARPPAASVLDLHQRARVPSPASPGTSGEGPALLDGACLNFPTGLRSVARYLAARLGSKLINFAAEAEQS